MPNNLVKLGLGQRIRVARRNADLTLAEVGRRIGISNQALSAIERGKKNPSKQTLMSLARVLKTDFGERWLAAYLSEDHTEIQLIPLNKQGVPKEELLHLFRAFLDHQYGPGQIDLVEDYEEQSVSLPLQFELTEHGIHEIKNASETLLVPPHMVPPGKDVGAALVKDWLIPDAFIASGDIIIFTPREGSPIGKIILAFVTDKHVIRRCKKKGRDVALVSLIDGYEPIETKLKQFVFMAEITGLLRFYRRD
jgi:transcriptional regulator with XRE-family HTH domain